MLWLTLDATIVCAHELGNIRNVASQSFVTIAGRPVLVATDPEGRSIVGCPNIGAAIRPCLTTLAVKSGYSAWITIQHHSVSLDTLSGLTDGTPPATVLYKVRHPGQAFVGEQ